MLQGDTLAPYLSVITLDLAVHNTIDNSDENLDFVDDTAHSSNRSISTAVQQSRSMSLKERTAHNHQENEIHVFQPIK